jgi:hypothetical protein
MVKKTLFLFLFTLLLLPARAQQLAPDDAFPRYKWEVGTDLLFFTKWRNVPPSLFVRLNTGSRAAWRFRVGGSYDVNVNAPDIVVSRFGSLISLKSQANAFASFGREWQQELGPFQIFYGSDIFLRYLLLRSKEGIIHIPAPRTFYPLDQDLSFGLSPFIGIQYYFFSRFSLSVESHLDLAYRRVTYENFIIPNNGELIYLNHRYDYFSASLRPVYILNLLFHF